MITSMELLSIRKNESKTRWRSKLVETSSDSIIVARAAGCTRENSAPHGSIRQDYIFVLHFIRDVGYLGFFWSEVRASDGRGGGRNSDHTYLPRQISEFSMEIRQKMFKCHDRDYVPHSVGSFYFGKQVASFRGFSMNFWNSKLVLRILCNFSWNPDNFSPKAARQPTNLAEVWQITLPARSA